MLGRKWHAAQEEWLQESLLLFGLGLEKGAEEGPMQPLEPHCSH